MPLAPGARIVELGSGKAALLIRLLRRWPGTSAEGFDRNRWFMAEARAAADEAGVAGRLSLIDTDSPGALLAGRSVDLAIAMGATGIVGDQAETLSVPGVDRRPGRARGRSATAPGSPTRTAAGSRGVRDGA